MFAKLRIAAAALAACLCMQMTAFAAPTYLTAEYKDHKYQLEMDAGLLFDIPMLEYGQEYKKTMRFENNTRYDIKVSMIDVINDQPEDARIYDISNLKVLIDGKEVFAGDMNDARWTKTVSPGDGLDIEYIYYTDELPHVPDNSWMNAKGKWAYVFVGEYERHVEGGFSGETLPSKEQGTTGGPDESKESNESNKSDESESDSGNETGGSDEGGKKPDVIVKLPDTGDQFPYGMLLAVMGLSGTGAAGLVISRRKRHGD